MREPTPDEQRLMILGGFETLAEYHQWLREPTDPAVLAKLDEPDYEQEVIDEMIEAGEWPTDDDSEEDLQEEG
jgi:hypothetical protein